MKKVNLRQVAVGISKKKLSTFRSIFLEQFITRFMVSGKKFKSESFLYNTIFLLEFFFKAKFNFLLHDFVVTNLSPNKLVFKRVRKDLNSIPLIVSLNSNLKNVIKLCILNLKSSAGQFFNKVFKFVVELFNNIN